MGMNVLRCQSPKMIHKELEMFFIAYNLIRGLMLQASQDPFLPSTRTRKHKILQKLLTLPQVSRHPKPGGAFTRT